MNCFSAAFQERFSFCQRFAFFLKNQGQKLVCTIKEGVSHPVGDRALVHADAYHIHIPTARDEFTEFDRT